MSLTKEELKINKWAEDNCTELIKENILSKIDAEKQSYWVSHNAKNDISEYGFETMPEFEECIREYLGNNVKEAAKTVTIATFKSKNKLKSVEELKKNCVEIPDFIYVF